MTSMQLLVCDCSTVANFKSWGKAISDFFLAAGWVKAADTGQVDWTAISSVPAAGNYVYEMWKPGDGLTTFLLKVEYGYTNNPVIALAIGLTTNGAGSFTGVFMPRTMATVQPPAAPSPTVTYNCFLSGSNNRIGVAMWAGVSNAQFFGVERSVDASGAYTGTYATLWTLGNVGFGPTGGQRSYWFSPPGLPPATQEQGSGLGWALRGINPGFNTGFNNSIPMDTCAPHVGYFDYPCTLIGCVNPNDLADQVTFETTLYGATRTYMPIKGPNFGNATNNNCCIILRWD